MSIPVPTRGSGKNNSVLKRDIARALVSGVFPDLSDEEVTKMVDAICGEIKERESPIPDDTNETMLKLLSALDPQEKESFEPLIKEALDKLESQEKKALNRMKFEAKLKAQGALPSMNPEPKAAKAAAARAEASGARAALFARQRAPEEFTKYLPDVPSLYLHWEPRGNRVYAEFKKLEGYQRTKSGKFDKNRTLQSKVVALALVFEFIYAAYHMKFTSLPNYNPDYKPFPGVV